ncbi:MAG: tRNA (N6-isopentenyl adenosine(37)-C2)-methylthiotransferase MiaB [Deltaproteobacteria bacterium]|nr:tRNA (N6-isopentenyl adenosine(37)-C2)-methylthiotransferase MiaB [Deltaproteobacteria bacterium]
MDDLERTFSGGKTGGEVPLRNRVQSLFIKTYGCQMNEYDSEKICTLLAGSHVISDRLDDADVVFINTCSVRDKAEQKFISLLGTLRDFKLKKPSAVIGVGGCVAQAEGTTIIKKYPFVDFVVGTHNLSLVPSIIAGVRDGRRRQVVVDYREEWEDLPDGFLPDGEVVESHTPQSSALYNVRALVAVQRGCSKNCSFCVVPKTRGSEVSRLPNEIERELRLKVRQGAREVLLLGQTVNSYGRDLSPRQSFEDLIRRIAEIDGLQRIRFTSPHPQEVRPAFMKLFEEIPKLCRHIHLPLQSGSDRILKLMNRNYRVKRYLDIVNELKQYCPDIAISTDIIVGFPTETDADFEQTLEVMRTVSFNFSYSFSYSRRPGTAAASDFDISEEVRPEIAKDRLLTLQKIQDEMNLACNSRMVGNCVQVLVEGEGKYGSGTVRGRTSQNAWVELSNYRALAGALVDVRITHASEHGMRGDALNMPG